MENGELKKFVPRRKKEIPEGLWMKCDGCKKPVYKKQVEELFKVCPECNYHFPLSSKERIEMMVDNGTFEEYFTDISPCDPLGFKGVAPYTTKIEEAQKETSLKDAAVIGKGKIKNLEVVFGVTDSRFMMGSMGSVVGEKVTRACELSLDLKIPLIITSGSGGGARMYEGCLSLMQMCKTSAAVARLQKNKILYISILTNPTMAGVMASFASLGTIIIAEPKALLGFTGPRVIEQTIKQKLPEGFQTSEFLLEHGFVDLIVDRTELKQTVSSLLDMWFNKSL